MTLKLYHKNTLIGTITNVSPEDTFEMSGDITLTPDASGYRPLFDYLTNEEMFSGEDLPFDEGLLNEWFLEDENGNRHEIVLPAIYFDDNEVLWRE